MKKEQLLRDIRSIAYHLDKGEGGPIKMADLSDKLEKLMLAVEEATPEAIVSGVTTKENFNVIILTVIPKELEALANVFGIELSEEPYRVIKGLRLWKGTIAFGPPDNAKNLKILLGMIGTAGNLSSYLETDAVLREFSSPLVILCGIAAGNNIYSAGVADYVTYYENQRLEGQGEIQYRLKPIGIDMQLAKDLAHLGRQTNAWKEKLRSEIEKLKTRWEKYSEDDFLNKTWITMDWFEKLKIETGNIFAGEKLFADGTTWPTLQSRHEIGKESFAGEMEGYGFAYACESNRQQQFLIFRGISDFGGPEKEDPINKKYQILAALSAACLLHVYLTTTYRVPL